MKWAWCRSPQRQLAALLLTEGAVILPVGAALGIALGLGIAQMLVSLLSGVFDPAPEALVIPWTYLVLLTAAGMVSLMAALGATYVAARHRPVEVLRDL